MMHRYARLRCEGFLKLIIHRKVFFPNDTRYLVGVNPRDLGLCYKGTLSGEFPSIQGPSPEVTGLYFVMRMLTHDDSYKRSGQKLSVSSGNPL